MGVGVSVGGRSGVCVGSSVGAAVPVGDGVRLSKATANYAVGKVLNTHNKSTLSELGA